MQFESTLDGLSNSFDDLFPDFLEARDQFVFTGGAAVGGADFAYGRRGGDDDDGPRGFDEVNDAAEARGGGRGGGGGIDKPGKGGGGGPDKPGKDKGGTTDGGTTGGATDGGTTGGATDGGTTGGATDGGTTGGATDASWYTSGMDTPDGFNVSIHFNGSWSEAAKQGIMDAAELISDLIIGDVADYNGIDDIVIQAYNEGIDGGNGILAQGGWIQMRNDPMKLVAEGGIRVDSADVSAMLSNGTFEDVVFHEMLHAMGFGSTWSMTGLVENINGKNRFAGDNAIEAYHALYPEIAATDADSHLGVPLSNDGAHWDQGKFGDEVMSPVMGANEHLSDMTIAALEDMGYETGYGDSVLV